MRRTIKRGILFLVCKHVRDTPAKATAPVWMTESGRDSPHEIIACEECLGSHLIEVPLLLGKRTCIENGYIVQNGLDFFHNL